MQAPKEPPKCIRTGSTYGALIRHYHKFFYKQDAPMEQKKLYECVHTIGKRVL